MKELFFICLSKSTIVSNVIKCNYKNTSCLLSNKVSKEVSNVT